MRCSMACCWRSRRSAFSSRTPPIFPVVVWGVLPLPALIGADEALGETLVAVHRWTSRLLLALVLLHVAAALHHHLVRKDDVLRRMLPALPGRR